MIRKIGVVSDLHCGSIFGMLPPNFLTSDGVPKLQNAGQEYLWQCWNATIDYFKKSKVDAIVINGDVIDGRQQANRGTELSLPILFDQRDAAIECLRPLATLAPLYSVQGTEYHGDRAGDAAEEVGKALNAVRYSGVGTGKWSKEVLDLDVDGVVLNFAHGISVAGGFYRATAVDREGVWSALAGKEGKVPKADCVIRSHCHFFVHVEHYSKHVAITPCFQLQTRYMRKNSVYRMQPDIGALIVHVDGDAKKEGRDPIWIEKILYPLPAQKPVKVRLE